MKKYKLMTAMLTAALVLGLTACGGKATGSTEMTEMTGVFTGTAEADTVVIDITAEPAEMNSLLACDTTGISVMTHCLSGLARLDKNDKPIADLAEKWEINDDHTEYTFYLKKDAKWSNGESVTAKDYYFSWVTQMKADTGSYMASFLYNNIKNGERFYNGEAKEEELGIEIIDDYTIKVQWEHPMANGLFLFTLPAYMPMNQKTYEEIGVDSYAKEADKIVTNGAYKITEWVHDSYIMMEKSEDYINASDIQIPKVKLVMIGDSNTRLNAFLAGELDMGNLYSEQINQIKEKSAENVYSFMDGSSYYIRFNMENEYLKNENLRKALSYSIDVQSLLDNVIADDSVMADGLTPGVIAGAGEKSYAEERGSLFAYNLDKAKEYMELALQELGISAADIKLSLNVADTSYSQNQAAYIQEEWKKNLGINVDIAMQPWKSLVEDLTNGNFDIEVEGNASNENSAAALLECFISDNPNNVGKYSNSEFDQLLKDANMEGDAVKKQDLLIQAEKLLIDDGVMAPLYFASTTYVVSDKLEGLVRTPFQYFNVCNGASIKTN